MRSGEAHDAAVPEGDDDAVTLLAAIRESTAAANRALDEAEVELWRTRDYLDAQQPAARERA